MKLPAVFDKMSGVLLCAITILVICNEWGLATWSNPLTLVLTLALIAILTIQVRLSRQVFVAVALGLSIALAVTNPDWGAIVMKGLGAAAFILAFFTALSTLRNVAETSPAIEHAGTFLAEQKPGRRYAALTVGGQAFALVLNYGAIQLLGALATRNANTEPNAEIRGHRIRRMLLAIQRGFVSTLPWSPLSFATVISISLIPGSSWTQLLVPGLVTSGILAGIGWGLDAVFKPRLSVTPVRAEPTETWVAMFPLLALLAVLVIGVLGLHEMTDVRIVGLVIVLVPVIALVWLLIQHWSDAPVERTYVRVKHYVLQEMPGFRGELILLMMAGYIGTVGSQLLGPLMLAAGLDLSTVPPWIILVGFVWITPLAGQMGMNPLMAVTLIAPLIPDAASLGVEPIALVVALTAGWALSGASSPFTATTLLIGSFAGISALRVGLVWNGAYVILCGLVLSLWVLIFAFWI